MLSMRCIVSGRVQGVWFRDTTRRKARELGANGSAKNLPDGSVEVLTVGADEQVRALCDWLWQGPPMSRVDDVRCEPVPLEAINGFTVG